MKLLGYILDEDDFEVVPTSNRSILTMELDEGKINNSAISETVVKNNLITYSFIWKPNAETQFSFTSLYDSNLTQLIKIENLTRIVISVNGVGVFDGVVLNNPLIVKANDVVTIRVYKNQMTIGSFKLIGNII